MHAHTRLLLNELNLIYYVSPLSIHTHLAVSQYSKHSGDENRTKVAAGRPHGSGHAANDAKGCHNLCIEKSIDNVTCQSA